MTQTTFRYGHFESSLRFRFKHASADRSETQNIIVGITDVNGRVGFGEGCPRQYVTGETTNSVHLFLSKYGREIVNSSDDLSKLRAWIGANEKVIDENPSAFCAIELAVLDLIGRRENLTVEALLALPELKQPISYTAVIGDNSPRKTCAIGLAYRLYGFTDFKVKLSGDFARDESRFATLPKRAKVRFDANNFWNNDDRCIAYLKKLKRPFWAIEEPVEAFNTLSQKTISDQLDTRIILDESLYLKEHLAPLSNFADQFIANIRVSKCGGILRSIELATKCHSIGVDVILGAHVGETSLLTRAALIVGQSLQKFPMAREGAYGKILLKHDLSEPALRFGLNGVLLPSSYRLSSKSGSGLTVNPESVNWLNCVAG